MNTHTGLQLHNAPRVQYPVGRSAFYAFSLGLGWLLGLAAWLAWCGLSDIVSGRHALVAGSLLGAGVWAVQSWRHQPSGWLTWDGQAWTWSSDPLLAGQALEIQVRADFQNHVLVQTQGGPAWLWLERRRLMARWLDVRRAAFSTPRGAGPDRSNERQLA